jgi:hypothetical protein
MDVAEAVAAVLPAKKISGAAQLDDVIRKQLGAAHDKSVARKTAVTDNKPASTATLERGEHSTGLFRKIGDDGISQLEEVDPTAVAAPRARRLSEQPMPAASSPDSGLHKLLDAHLDADRRTEVGGPPTGAVPKTEPEPEPAPAKRSTQQTKSITEDVATKPSRAPLAIGAVVVVAAGGFGIYQLTRHTPAAVVTPPPADAAVEEAMGKLEIDPDPEGATGTITGEDGVAHPFGPTSHTKKVMLRVTANKELKVHLEAPGYRPYDRGGFKVEPNVTLALTPVLSRLRASLHVVTTPGGAQVSLGGRFLGETPLTITDLEAAPHAMLSITHAGFETVKLEVALETGKTAEVSRDLTPLPKLGEVKINVKGAWAEVFFKGKKLGRNKNLSGLATFRLPVGKQRLVLQNTAGAAKKAKTITIDVTGGPQTVTVSLD